MGSGHLLFRLALNKDAYDTVKAVFGSAALNTPLYCGDILDHNKQYDFIYSTGLLQCLEEKARAALLLHVKKISGRCFYVVPETLCDRNMGSIQAAGVAGCPEYSVSGLPILLSKLYDRVRLGRLENVVNDSDFLYYICD
jgi:hypothetical protein